MIRNNTGFWLHYNAWNTVNNGPELNDAANHTLKLFIDGILLDPTNTPINLVNGECAVFVTAAESDGAKFIAVDGVSSTTDVSIIGGYVITDLLIPGTPFVGCFIVWDGANNQPATGETSLSLTMNIAQNNTSGGAINSPVELDALTVPGLYAISVTIAEANGTAVSILGASSTVDVNVMPTELAPFDVDYPIPDNVQKDIDYAEGTLTGTLETTIKGPIKLIKLDTGIQVIKL